jgi:hypothetical protein
VYRDAVSRDWESYVATLAFDRGSIGAEQGRRGDEEEGRIQKVGRQAKEAEFKFERLLSNSL